MAAYTLLAVQYRTAFFIQLDRLVSAVVAGDFAAAAAVAALLNELREEDRIPFQCISRFAQGVQSLADRFLHAAETFFRQVEGQPGLQVVDDPVTVLHDGCRDLDGAAAQQDEFHRVLPGLDPAHGGNVHAFQGWVLPQFGNEPQGDRFDGIAAVSAQGAVPMYGGICNKGVQVYAGD